MARKRRGIKRRIQRAKKRMRLRRPKYPFEGLGVVVYRKGEGGYLRQN